MIRACKIPSVLLTSLILLMLFTPQGKTSLPTTENPYDALETYRKISLTSLNTTLCTEDPNTSSMTLTLSEEDAELPGQERSMRNYTYVITGIEEMFFSTVFLCTFPDIMNTKSSKSCPTYYEFFRHDLSELMRLAYNNLYTKTYCEIFDLIENNLPDNLDYLIISNDDPYEVKVKLISKATKQEIDEKSLETCLRELNVDPEDIIGEKEFNTLLWSYQYKSFFRDFYDETPTIEILLSIAKELLPNFKLQHVKMSFVDIFNSPQKARKKKTKPGKNNSRHCGLTSKKNPLGKAMRLFNAVLCRQRILPNKDQVKFILDPDVIFRNTYHNAGFMGASLQHSCFITLLLSQDDSTFENIDFFKYGELCEARTEGLLSYFYKKQDLIRKYLNLSEHTVPRIPFTLNPSLMQRRLSGEDLAPLVSLKDITDE